jgi:hypothetical protein
MGLKTDKDQLCTWLSLDGGINWKDVIDDVYIYEFLNHGNIIALAKFRCVWCSPFCFGMPQESNSDHSMGVGRVGPRE